MRHSDGVFPLAPSNAAAGLQQSECKPRCSARSLGDEGQDFRFHVPVKCFASMAKQQGQFLVRVELETQGQFHPIPQAAGAGNIHPSC